MHEELAAIDLAPLDELTGIQQQLDVLAERMRTMEARRDQVAAPVYQRVREDYARQQAALEERAAPLRARAREEYARLHALLATCEADHAAIALDREEIEFRFALGEFDEAEHKRRLKAVDGALKEKAEGRTAAEALKQRFATAFGGEAALAQHAARPPEAPAQAETTQRMQALDAAALAAAAPPAPPAAEVGATQVMRTLKGSEAAPVRADQTVILRSARLVPQNPEAGKQNVTLALKPMAIGSERDCDIRVAGARARHAEVRVSMAGFTISDLGGGVRINGVPVEQHLLRQDDVIEIAAARFAFREG